jgi:hypothetical protein
MVAISYYETPIDFQQITRRYISKDRILHNYRWENRKFYVIN